MGTRASCSFAFALRVSSLVTSRGGVDNHGLEVRQCSLSWRGRVMDQDGVSKPGLAVE